MGRIKSICKNIPILSKFDARMNKMVNEISGWTSIFIGAITIILSEEVVELVSSSVPESIRVFLFIPVVLFFLYAQITVAYYLDKKDFLT